MCVVLIELMVLIVWVRLVLCVLCSVLFLIVWFVFIGRVLSIVLLDGVVLGSFCVVSIMCVL